MRRRLLLQAAGLVVLATGVSNASAGSYIDFFKAVERDDARTVTVLLRRGFDPNSRDERAQVAFSLALREPSPTVAEALWAHPALDVEAESPAGETPLMFAALTGQVGWMKRLLARGARVHREGWAPIHYAASGPEAQAVALLLRAGAPVDALSPNGSTPLMMAAGYGSLDGAELLLQAGADVRVRSASGWSAANFARQAGRDAFIERLERLARP